MTFWSLSVYDLAVPTSVYEKQKNSLHSQINTIEDNKDLVRILISLEEKTYSIFFFHRSCQFVLLENSNHICRDANHPDFGGVCPIFRPKIRFRYFNALIGENFQIILVPGSGIH